MPVNRNALIRYKTIDLCLQNRYRKWTLENLIEAVSEALYEYEGKKSDVSRRTIQLDIQNMRSDKLGYNAPIVVEEKKYYTYEDPKYSITNIPLSENDLSKLTETVDFLKQFKGFSHFSELEGMVQKLEDHIYSRKENRRPAIDFEKNENLKGLEYLNDLYRAITLHNKVEITYQSFTARQPGTFVFIPYLLKEFRNRWFVVGVKKKSDPILTLALDRIEGLTLTNAPFQPDSSFSPEGYFRDVIGVTVNNGCPPEKIVLFIHHKHAPYVLTKPLHHTQKVLERDGFGVTISLEVQHNYELEKEILSLGDGIVVLHPERLKRIIMEKANNTLDNYNSTLNEKGIVSIQRKLMYRGFHSAMNIYTRKEIRQLGYHLSKENISEIDINSNESKAMLTLLKNKTVCRIADRFKQGMEIFKVDNKRGIPDEYWQWSQQDYGEGLSLLLFIDAGKSTDCELQLVPGTHNKALSAEEQFVITSNCIPSKIPIATGGVVLLKPNLLRRFSVSEKSNNVKYLQLYFR